MFRNDSTAADREVDALLDGFDLPTTVRPSPARTSNMSSFPPAVVPAAPTSTGHLDVPPMAMSSSRIAVPSRPRSRSWVPAVFVLVGAFAGIASGHVSRRHAEKAHAAAALAEATENTNASVATVPVEEAAAPIAIVAPIADAKDAAKDAAKDVSPVAAKDSSKDTSVKDEPKPATKVAKTLVRGKKSLARGPRKA